MDFPKLRSVEVFPVEMDGRNLICFRDQLKITENIVLIPQQALPVIRLFDGCHSLRDIQADYMRTHGELLDTEQILGIAQELDEQYLLESERFQIHRKELESEFLQSSVRKSLLAGSGYDDDPAALGRYLNAFFYHHSGPGAAPHRPEEPAGLQALIAPHIDFMRGGPCYAWAYKEAAEHSDADVYVLFGTSHLPTERFFSLTRKSFETPFGVVPADQDILNRLASRLGQRFFADELVHRTEHSLEFQVVYLRYLFGDTRPFCIVPVLCGSFYELILRGQSPRDAEEITTFLDTLQEILAQDGRKTCLIAGADLAHVGPQFGDRDQISQQCMETLQSLDASMLDYAVQGDEEGFYRFIMDEKDRRRICGLPPVYALLRLLEHNADGRLLKYSQWRDPQGNGAVTFAGLAYYS